LREQTLTQKVGNRSGIGNKARSGAMTQRPARRERGGAESFGSRLRALLAFLPLILKVGLTVVVASLAFLGYRAAGSARFLQIRNVEVQGISRASNVDVQTLVRREVGKTGVWNADLNDITTKLEHLPWIRTAVVSRVLPDGIRVRISERIPRAVVRLSSGRFRWVDEDAVLLGDMVPADQMRSFFLRGWNEDESESARKENMERVRTFLALEREWNTLGLSERVSEVNLIDVRDVRAQLAGQDSQIEIRLGAEDFGPRLRKALELLDEQRNTTLGPFITYIIMNQRNPIVGHSVAVKTANNSATETTDTRKGEDRNKRN
jgi:cell division protein FtsQ